MPTDLFAAVDRYIEDLFVPSDAVLSGAVEAGRNAGLPQVQISPVQGKFLWLLARLIGARRILEIGTLAGYSTISLARALPADGRLVTLERDPKHATVARGNLDRAGLAERVEVRVGPALEGLAALGRAGEPPMDLVFIDADEASYTEYLDWAVRLSRSGSVIVADNVIHGGAVMSHSDDEWTRGAQAFNAKLSADDRLEAIVLQQVGVSGHDGMAIARVK